jgi:hypothetical protein
MAGGGVALGGGTSPRAASPFGRSEKLKSKSSGSAPALVRGASAKLNSKSEAAVAGALAGAAEGAAARTKAPKPGKLANGSQVRWSYEADSDPTRRPCSKRTRTSSTLNGPS